MTDMAFSDSAAALESRNRRRNPTTGPTAVVKFLTAFALLTQVLLSPVTCSHRQVDRRTTWPTETGTMVRILRHDPSATWYTGSDEDFGSEDFQLQQQLLQRQQLQDNGFGKRAAGPLDYIMRRKKDLFLRTSRDVGLSSADKDCLEDGLDGCGEGAYAPVLGKRGGKRDNGKGKAEIPFLFRTSKRSSEGHVQHHYRPLSDGEKQWLANVVMVQA